MAWINKEWMDSMLRKVGGMIESQDTQEQKIKSLEEEQEKLKKVVSSALQLNTALSSRMDSLSERLDKQVK